MVYNRNCLRPPGKTGRRFLVTGNGTSAIKLMLAATVCFVVMVLALRHIGLSPEQITALADHMFATMDRLIAFLKGR